MSIPPLSTTFPNAPLTDGAGQVTQAWRTFLLALWRRTGAVAGIDSGAAASGLAAETAARQAQDVSLSTAIASEAAARAAAIAAEAAMRAAGDSYLGGSSVSVTAAILAEQAARIADVDTETAARIAADSAETAARIAGDAAAPRPLALLVTGDVPVGIVSTPDGNPVYVTL